MTWKQALAEALDEQALTLGHTVAQLAHAHEVLEARGRDELCHELRALAAGLRSEATELTGEARRLRTDPATNGLPAAITSRYARRALAAPRSEQENPP